MGVNLPIGLKGGGKLVTDILIADDEKNIRYLIRALVSGLGLPVRVVGEAADGEECLALFGKHKPSIVITDIVMPLCDGLELLGGIKALAPDAIIILLSAHQNFEYAQRALRHSAFDYLLKPVQEREMRRVLEKALKRLGEIKANRVRVAQMKEKMDKYEMCLTGNEAPEETRHLDPIEKSIHYIDRNFNQDISLKEASARSFFSIAYFSEQFKKKTGKSFNDYLNDLRISKAREFLLIPELKVAEVAELVGYNNCSYFISAFRKKTGKTPNDYRKNQLDALRAKGERNS